MHSVQGLSGIADAHAASAAGREVMERAGRRPAPAGTAPPPALPVGWRVLRDCNLSGRLNQPVMVPLVLIHPEVGVALIETAPGSGHDAEAVLRARLAAARFDAIFPGSLPILHLGLTAADMPALEAILAEGFAAQPPLSLPGGDAWISVVERALSPRDPRRAASYGGLPGRSGRTGAAAQPVSEPPGTADGEHPAEAAGDAPAIARRGPTALAPGPSGPAPGTPSARIEPFVAREPMAPAGDLRRPAAAPPRHRDPPAPPPAPALVIPRRPPGITPAAPADPASRPPAAPATEVADGAAVPASPAREGPGDTATRMPGAAPRPWAWGIAGLLLGLAVAGPLMLTARRDVPAPQDPAVPSPPVPAAEPATEPPSAAPAEPPQTAPLIPAAPAMPPPRALPEAPTERWTAPPPPVATAPSRPVPPPVATAPFRPAPPPITTVPARPVPPPAAAPARSPPPSAAESQVTVRSAANLRPVPTTGSAVLRTAQRGESFLILGRAPGGWVQVGTTEGPLGWIHSSLLEERGAPP